MLPNFLVVGAARSGTTYLDRLLRQHPQVYLPQVRKELNHFTFTPEEIQEKRFEYQGYFTPTTTQTAVGEISPSYMLFENAAASIAEQLGQIRLVFILRNPVKRAYSDYHLQLYKGYEYLTFPEALKKETERVSKGRLERLRYSYTGRGYYLRQIQRFVPLFPPETMHFIISEDFYKDTRRELNRLCRFLGIDDGFPFDLEVLQYHVETPRFNLMYRGLVRLHRRGSEKKGLYRPAKLARYLYQRMPMDKRPYPPMGAECERLLHTKFSAENQALEKFLGRDLDEWQT